MDRAVAAASGVLRKNPITGIAACCARIDGTEPPVLELDARWLEINT
ncbi:MAG: hypothetical protein WAV78_42515 [Xanthobacteraceae bacterium]